MSDGQTHGPEPDLDRIDRMLIAALQADAGVSAEKLSQAIALSPSALTRRIKRLRDTGWLGATVVLPGAGLTERRLHCLVRVQMAQHAERSGIAELRRRLIALPEVQMLLDCAGDIDLTVLVSARDMASFNRLAAELFENNSAVRRFETTIVRRVRKHVVSEPIDERPEA
jgi:Lrp/AsnC family leucine-responsive transcriptional regulator